MTVVSRSCRFRQTGNRSRRKLLPSAGPVVRVRTLTNLLVKPRELDRGNLADEFGNGPGGVRRQGVVSRQQGYQIWDNANLTRRGDLCEAGDPKVLTADKVSAAIGLQIATERAD